MIFNSGWSKSDIWSLTYRELFELADLFYKQHYEKMFDFFKMFCVANAESSMVAFSDKSDALRKYADDIKNRSISSKEEFDVSDIEDQFKKVNFDGK